MIVDFRRRCAAPVPHLAEGSTASAPIQIWRMLSLPNATAGEELNSFKPSSFEDLKSHREFVTQVMTCSHHVVL
jgi:hypothetical protein